MGRRGQPRKQGKRSVQMKGGLGKWFGEKWVDVKTGKANVYLRDLISKR